MTIESVENRRQISDPLTTSQTSADKAMTDAVHLAKTSLKLPASREKVERLQKAAFAIAAASKYGGFDWGSPPPEAALLDNAIQLAVQEGRAERGEARENKKKGKPVVGQKLSSSMKTNTKTTLPRNPETTNLLKFTN